MGQNIPNTDGDSSQLVYTPTSSTPESDTIRYSVTDNRIGHTREGLITIIGPFSPSVPEAVDDFAFTLSGNTLQFTWNHPNDGGSSITFYKVERSADTISWQLHDTYSETTTNFDYLRHPGYDKYFRIFANNDLGASSASNIIYAYIPDDTAPVVTIQTVDDQTETTPSLILEGNVNENQNTGIEDIEIRIDNVLSADPINIQILSQDSFVTWDSFLSNLSNGVHTLSAFASNRDGLTGTDSITVTIAAPVPQQLDSFLDEFETDMSNWFVYTEDGKYWSIRDSPILQIPDSLSGNQVAGTENCDNVCTMVMVDYVDLTSMSAPTLSFYRYVATGADTSNHEGITVYVSEDKGSTWLVLDSFTADEFEDDGLWHLEEYDLTRYVSDEFTVKFEGRSSSSSEDTELDDVKIFDADAIDNTPPVITIPFDIITEATDINTSVDIGMATATDDVDSNPIIKNNSTGLFPLGNTVILWTATDDSDNFSTATQTITIQDTIAPIFDNVPIDLAFMFLNEQSRLVNYFIPTASDIVDSSVDVFCNPLSGTEFAVGTTTVTCTATDNSGNSSSVSFNIIVSFNDSSVISDTFDSNLDSWTLHERPNIPANNSHCSSISTSYSLIHSSEHGGSAHTDSQNKCWFGGAGGIKSFDFPSGYNTLHFSILNSTYYRDISKIFIIWKLN